MLSYFQRRGMAAVAALALLLSLAPGVNAQGFDPMVEMHKIYRQVAQDAVRQYEMVKRSGDEMDRCVHAGMVAQAFLMANDEASYRKWKAIEKADCRQAGLR